MVKPETHCLADALSTNRIRRPLHLAMRFADRQAQRPVPSITIPVWATPLSKIFSNRLFCVYPLGCHVPRYPAHWKCPRNKPSALVIKYLQSGSIRPSARIVRKSCLRKLSIHVPRTRSDLDHRYIQDKIGAELMQSYQAFSLAHAAATCRPAFSTSSARLSRALQH